MRMTLNDGTHWEPEAEQVAKWKEAFPAIEVDRELAAASAWLDSNPTRRKTKRGIARFCNSWLSRAQDKGGSGMAKPRSGKTATRDMSSLDELTHDFLNDENYRRTCLAKHGQYFGIDGQRHTE